MPTQTCTSLTTGLAASQIARIHLEARVLEGFETPRFAGPAVRSVLGAALKRGVCLHPPGQDQCGPCFDRPDCAYAALWEPLAPAGAARPGFASVPHPYTLHVAGRGAGNTVRWQAGDVLAFELTLARPVVDLVQIIVRAAEAALARGIGQDRGRRGELRLEAVRDLAPDGGGRELFRRGLGWAHQRPRVYAAAEEARKLGYSDAELSDPTRSWRLLLDLATPLRLMRRGVVLRAGPLPFDALVSAALNRVSAFCHFHEGVELDLDFKGLIARAGSVEAVKTSLQFQDLSRWSAGQRRRHPLGGLVGTVEYRGRLGPFVPLLAAVEGLHLGKATTSGLGRVELVDLEPTEPAAP